MAVRLRDDVVGVAGPTGEEVDVETRAASLSIAASAASSVAATAGDGTTGTTSVDASPLAVFFYEIN